MHKVLAIALAIPLAGATLTAAAAMPSSSLTTPQSDLFEVRLVCNANRCIDPQTGSYTQSGCNYRGCYPISGVVGRTYPQGGGYGYGYGYRPRYMYGHRGYRDYDGD